MRARRGRNRRKERAFVPGTGLSSLIGSRGGDGAAMTPTDRKTSVLDDTLVRFWDRSVCNWMCLRRGEEQVGNGRNQTNSTHAHKVGLKKEKSTDTQDKPSSNGGAVDYMYLRGRYSPCCGTDATCRAGHLYQV